MKNDQVLLGRRIDNQLWGLPGGSLELGDSLEETTKRELFEESGLEAVKVDLFNVFSGKDLYYKYPHGDEIYNVVAFLCHEYTSSLKEELTDRLFK